MTKTIDIIEQLNERAEAYPNEVASSLTSMKSVYKNLAEMQMKNLNGASVPKKEEGTVDDYKPIG